MKKEILLLAATFVPTIASAATATANLSNINFEVIYGTTPTAFWDSSASVAGSLDYSNGIFLSDSDNTNILPPSYIFDISASVDNSGDHAYADADYDPADSNSGLSSEVAITSQGTAYAHNYTSITFQYVANTLLKISADASITGSVDFLPNGLPVSDSTAYAGLTLYEQSGAAAYFSQSTQLYSWGDFNTAQGLSLFYYSDKDTTLNFYADTGVYANLSVTAVPEPESVSMLLAGLGLLGGAVRRNRS